MEFLNANTKVPLKIINMEDVELYNGHENDGSEVPPHLR